MGRHRWRFTVAAYSERVRQGRCGERCMRCPVKKSCVGMDGSKSGRAGAHRQLGRPIRRRRAGSAPHGRCVGSCTADRSVADAPGRRRAAAQHSSGLGCGGRHLARRNECRHRAGEAVGAVVVVGVERDLGRVAVAAAGCAPVGCVPLRLVLAADVLLSSGPVGVVMVMVMVRTAGRNRLGSSPVRQAAAAERGPHRSDGRHQIDGQQPAGYDVLLAHVLAIDTRQK